MSCLFGEITVTAGGGDEAEIAKELSLRGFVVSLVYVILLVSIVPALLLRLAKYAKETRQLPLTRDDSQVNLKHHAKYTTVFYSELLVEGATLACALAFEEVFDTFFDIFLPFEVTDIRKNVGMFVLGEVLPAVLLVSLYFIWEKYCARKAKAASVSG